MELIKTRGIFLVFMLSMLIIGCDKPNPNPELIDPIYSDLEKQLKDAEATQKSALQTEQEMGEALKKVKPQTGQIKFAQKRYNEAMSMVQKAEQRVEFLKLRVKSRKAYDQRTYLAAYKKKEPWPSPSELQEYNSQKALENAPRNWNAKDRIEKMNAPPPKASEHGEH